MAKKNPNKIPRTQADVDRAFMDGMAFGIQGGIELFLYVLVDKHNATQEELDTFAGEVNSLCQSVNEGYVTFADIRKMLTEEYRFKFEGLTRRKYR